MPSLNARFALLGLGALMLSSAAEPATTKTAKFNVTATIQSDCVIAATDLAFGNIGIVSANVDATSTLSITCTPATNYSVSLNAGTAPASTVDNRLMANGINTLQFQLFSDATRLSVWGETAAVNVVGGTGTGTLVSITIYGRVPPQTTPAAGLYSTEITATITY